MKKIAAIGLLVLLLYNMFGLSFAVFFFENDYKIATSVSDHDDWKMVKLYLPSLPYTDNWETTEGTEGLIQEDGNFYNATHIQHTNDTLYVTLKSNLAAREQFYGLADKLRNITDQSIPESNQNKTLKIVNNFVKNYIPNSPYRETEKLFFEYTLSTSYQLPANSLYACFEMNLNTPPPENA